MKKTYVIVDDDLAFSLLLEKQLSKFSSLECAATYHDTLSAARGISKLKPDILFLDMEIDSLNGLEVLESLENKPKTIVISSSTRFMETALSLEVYDYLKKPVQSMDRLKTALRKVMA